MSNFVMPFAGGLPAMSPHSAVGGSAPAPPPSPMDMSADFYQSLQHSLALGLYAAPPGAPAPQTAPAPGSSMSHAFGAFGMDYGSQSPAAFPKPAYVIPLSRRPDCMYFIRGSCHKGDDCVFRHNELARRGPQEICPRWEREKQCDDSACMLLHPKVQAPGSSARDGCPSPLGVMPSMPPGPAGPTIVLPQFTYAPPSSALTPASAQSSQQAMMEYLSVSASAAQRQPLSPTALASPSAAGAGQQYIPFPRRPDCMFFVRGSCSKADKCVFRHSEKAKYGTQEACQTWERTGKCEDPHCPHLHPKPNPPVSPKAPIGQTPGQYPPIPWSRRPDCMFYVRGSCHKGDKCVFRHNEKAKYGTQELCPAWAATGVCNDQSCAHVHPKQQKDASALQIAASPPLTHLTPVSGLPAFPSLNTPAAPSPPQSPGDLPRPPPYESVAIASLPATPTQGLGMSRPSSVPSGLPMYLMSPKHSTTKGLPSTSIPPSSAPQPSDSGDGPSSLATAAMLFGSSSRQTEGLAAGGEAIKRQLQVDPTEEGRIAREAALVLASATGSSMAAPRLSERVGTRQPLLLQTLSRLSGQFCISDTLTPRVWLYSRESADDVAVAMDVFGLLSQAPENSLALAALRPLVRVPPSVKLLDVVRAHTELFILIDPAPFIVKLEPEAAAEQRPRSLSGSCASPGIMASFIPKAPSPAILNNSTPAAVVLATPEDHAHHAEEEASKERDVSPTSLDHVLEAFEFPQSTSDATSRVALLRKVLQPYLDSLSVNVKWVDDSHALAIFCNSAMAKQALVESKSAEVRMRPFSEATDSSKDLAKTEDWGKPVASPMVIPPGGTIAPGSGPVTVTMRCDTPGAAIHYTTNGTTPALISPLYTGPITVDRPMRLQACAFKNGLADSRVTSVRFSEPILIASPTGSPQDTGASSPTVLPVDVAKDGPLSAVSGRRKKMNLSVSIPIPTHNINVGGTGGQQFWVIPFKEIVFDDEKRQTTVPVILGGYGSVFSGKMHSSSVCVRQLGEASSADASFVQQELTALSNIRHQNLLFCFGVCVPPDPVCIVTENLCGGCSLQAVLSNPNIQLTKKDRYGFALEIARGMQFLHRRSILHLGLRPSSVLLTTDGCLKVCDFGLYNIASRMGLVPSPGGSSSISYTAPEVFTGVGISTKSDVFSFGSILWHLYTRRAPYDTATAAQLIATVVRKHERPKIPMSCSYGYGRMISKCWAHEPSARPSFDRIIEKLEAIIKEDFE